MTGFKNPLHGRTHREMGSDPIWPPSEAAIRFSTSPQEGDWLEVTTTTVGPSTQGIYLHADVASIATPGILLSTDGILELDSSHVEIGSHVEIDVTPTVTTFGFGSAAFYPREVNVLLDNTTTNPQGSKFAIYDANGVSILEVRDDGTFHIKTGGTWAADL